MMCFMGLVSYIPQSIPGISPRSSGDGDRLCHMAMRWLCGARAVRPAQRRAGCLGEPWMGSVVFQLFAVNGHM
jgi:hypothetical protein